MLSQPSFVKENSVLAVMCKSLAKFRIILPFQSTLIPKILRSISKMTSNWLNPFLWSRNQNFLSEGKILPFNHLLVDQDWHFLVGYARAHQTFHCLVHFLTSSCSLNRKIFYVYPKRWINHKSGEFSINILPSLTRTFKNCSSFKGPHSAEIEALSTAYGLRVSRGGRRLGHHRSANTHLGSSR